MANCVMATPSADYLFKHVKHGTQNIQNDCHQWLTNSFGMHQIRFRPGLPRLLIAGLRGPTSKGNGKGIEKGRRNEGKKREGKGDRPLFANSWIRPCCT